MVLLLISLKADMPKPKQPAKQRGKKDQWFAPVRGSYLPANSKGLAVYLVYVVYIIVVSVHWILSARSWKTLIFSVLPTILLAAAATQLFAASKSRAK
jgi:type IV secretory pathway VirB2 component (pilin)